MGESHDGELKEALAAAEMVLGKVWGQVSRRSSASVDRAGVRLTVTVAPLPGLARPPTPALFDNTPEPVPGDPPGDPDAAPPGVRPLDWRVAIAVRDMRAGGAAKVCRKQIVAHLERASGMAESTNSVAHALTRLVAAGHLVQVSRAGGYAPSPKSCLTRKAQSSPPSAA
ncbi:hypothetical protein [Gemmata sp.]|uniref:hypothetical protein n=1 Tax=Gemmata sp. TaxID=1914242 RepID=UPI003F6E7BA0